MDFFAHDVDVAEVLNGVQILIEWCHVIWMACIQYVITFEDP